MLAFFKLFLDLKKHFLEYW